MNTSARVADAFEAVPRVAFLPRRQQRFAQLDQALDIGYGVTNSQPTTVRDMLELLDPQPGDRVLDVGSGSGWTTALLARLVGRDGSVIGVERIRQLVKLSREAVRSVISESATGNFGAVEIHEAEAGVLGWPAEAPYDRVLVSAAADRLPTALVDQLEVGGVLVAPVQGVMLRVTRTEGEPEVEQHGRYVFVPLIE
jgi:protein-L-isoaspartate(D-aspartate) O-methyltransferase